MDKENALGANAAAVACAGSIDGSQLSHVDPAWHVSFLGGEIIVSARRGTRHGSVNVYSDGEIVVAVSGRDEKTQVEHETLAHRAFERLGAWLGAHELGYEGDEIPLPDHGFVESGNATQPVSEASGSVPSAAQK